MSNIGEISGQQSQSSNILATGYDVLDNVETLILKRYTRYILPLDGFAFWILDTDADELSVEGSLHFSTQVIQREDETIGVNAVLLTTKTEIQDLNAVALNSMYIGSSKKGEIRFAFSATGKFFKQSNIWHYRGDAIYPAMFSQIIDNPILPISIPQIATNSLPLWISLSGIQNQFSDVAITFNSMMETPTIGDILTTVPPRVCAVVVGVYGDILDVVVNVGSFESGDVVNNYTASANIGIIAAVNNGVPTIYPSYLIPSNIQPPYIGVDIATTDCLQATPHIDENGNHSQLMMDKIKLTLYGLNNNQAMDFLDFVNEYTLLTENMGIMNTPRVLDEKRTQAEMRIIAQKKTIEFEISYYQYRVNDISQQLILSCLPNFIFQ
jgi:hypothetical protein